MIDKNLIGYISMIVAVAGYIPYYVTILNGKTKPHAFSWITWTFAIILVFVAQMSRGAGPGAWVTGISALACIGISVLALLMGDKDITRGDEMVFGVALASIPLWVVTRDPLWSVALMVIINHLGFIPTFRKTYRDPHSENLPFYYSVVIKFALGMVALDRLSLVTALFPLNCVLINILFLAMIYWRRHELALKSARSGVPVLPSGSAPVAH